MLILNFAHPLTPAQLAGIEAAVGEPLDVRDVPVQLDLQEALAPQCEEIIEGVGLSAERWQNDPVLVCLPSLNHAAAVFLADLHGRMGYFPGVIRLREVKDSPVKRFEYAEILKLGDVRANARGKRTQ